MLSMQHIFVVYLFIVATGLQQTHAEGSSDLNKLEKFYYDKCLKNTGTTTAFDKLRTDTYEMYEYLKYTFQFLPNQRETFCKNERSNLIYRIKDVTNDLKPCLMQDEKFLADLIKESFTQFLHFFCHNNGEYTRRFFGNEGSQCRKKIEESNTSDLDNCLNRIFAPRKIFITKDEMCDDVTVAKKCFTHLLDVHCPRSYDFKKLNEIFFEYVGKPCNSCIHMISTFVLVGSLLIHFFANKCFIF